MEEITTHRLVRKGAGVRIYTGFLVKGSASLYDTRRAVLTNRSTQILEHFYTVLPVAFSTKRSTRVFRGQSSAGRLRYGKISMEAKSVYGPKGFRRVGVFRALLGSLFLFLIYTRFQIQAYGFLYDTRRAVLAESSTHRS